MSARDAVDALRRRLEERLADPADDDEHAALREGLARLPKCLRAVAHAAFQFGDPRVQSRHCGL